MRNYLIVLLLASFGAFGCSGISDSQSVTTTSDEPKSPSVEKGSLVEATALPSIVFLGWRGRSAEDLLSVAEDGSVVNWDIQEGNHSKLLQVSGRIDGAALSPSGDQIAVRRGSRVGVFSLRGLSQIASLSRIKAKINALQFDSKGETLLLGGADGNVYRWRYGSVGKDQKSIERVLERYAGHPSVVSAVANHPTGEMFFSGDWQGTIMAWRIYDADEFRGEYDKNLFDPSMFGENAMRTFRQGQGSAAIERLRLSEDGAFLVVGLASGVVELWRVRGFLRLASIEAHRGTMYDVDISPDGKRIVTAGRDGFVRFWDVETKDDPAKIASSTMFKLTKSKEISLGSVRRLMAAESRVYAGSVDGSVFELS